MRQLSQRAIEAFLMTFRMGSISAAAEVMNLSQPAISRLLKDLEAELEFPLFHRIKGRLHRTVEGTAFHDEVSRAFIGLDRIRLAADNIRQGHRFRLEINALPALASTCLADIIAEFLIENPATTISTQPVLTEEIIRRVRAYECNFGIVESRDFPADITEFHVHRERAVCILPPHHPLKENDVIEPKDFAGQVFVHTINGAQLGDLAWNMLLENDIKCRSIVECQLAYLMQKLVMAGVGIAVADPRTATVHAEGGGLVKPLSVPLFCCMSFIRRNDTVLTGVENRFTRHAIHYLSSKDNMHFEGQLKS